MSGGHPESAEFCDITPQHLDDELQKTPSLQLVAADHFVRGGVAHRPRLLGQSPVAGLARVQIQVS
jgi:hypothetical protein